MRIASTLIVASFVLLAGCSSGDDDRAQAQSSMFLDEYLSGVVSGENENSETGQRVTGPSSRMSTQSAAKEASKETDSPSSVPASDEDQINDMAYLSTLDTYDIPYPSKSVAVRLAHAICDNYDSGMSELDNVMAIVAAGKYSPEQAMSMVGAATALYCPDY